jgi:hypothetical protein
MMGAPGRESVRSLDGDRSSVEGLRVFRTRTASDLGDAGRTDLGTRVHLSYRPVDLDHRVSRCPLTGEKQKSRGSAATSVFDPSQTSATSAQQFSSIMQAGSGRGYCCVLR